PPDATRRWRFRRCRSRAQQPMYLWQPRRRRPVWLGRVSPTGYDALAALRVDLRKVGQVEFFLTLAAVAWSGDRPTTREPPDVAHPKRPFQSSLLSYSFRSLI